MQENTTLFRLGLSTVGGVITGLLGLVVGLTWSFAIDTDRFLPALALGVIGFIWGAVSVQLTPTGGVIIENRTTVNYALLVTYAWIAAFGCILALGAFVVRAAIF